MSAQEKQAMRTRSAENAEAVGWITVKVQMEKTTVPVIAMTAAGSKAGTKNQKNGEISPFFFS